MAEKKGGTKKVDRKNIPMPPEKTANWPGLPGKKQPRDRSLGIKKVKQAVVENF